MSVPSRLALLCVAGAAMWAVIVVGVSGAVGELWSAPSGDATENAQGCIEDDTTGDLIAWPRNLQPSECVATTTTSPPASTTTAPTTTSTVPPTSTTSTSTTTTLPSTGFSEDFTGDTGLERFRTGIAHRNLLQGGGNHEATAWEADHDLTCGPPTDTRTINSPDMIVDDEVYLCRDHLMTSMGDVDAYSIVWFSPDQTFTSERVVSWDANITLLGDRQWWEVAVLPAGFAGDAVCIPWLACDSAVIPDYPAGSLGVGSGPFGGSFTVNTAGNILDDTSYCRHPWEPFHQAEECTSKAVRVPASLVDNGDGTVTFTIGTPNQVVGDSPQGWSETFPGSFPASFKVVFKDHNYTPDKEGVPPGYTWHWDNITVAE